MTHQYPAVLLPQEAEDIERAVAAYRHTLVQAYIHAREWQRQAEQMSASLNAERAAHEATKRELKAMERTASAIADERMHMANELFVLQRQLGETQAGIFTRAREPLAAYAHEAWSAYMDYFLDRCDPGSTDGLIIPWGYVKSLRELIATPYADLSEDQKDNDRKEADAILSLLADAASGVDDN